MAYGVIGFAQPSDATQPSGSIWGNCSSQELRDEGTGVFVYKDFVDDSIASTVLPNAAQSGATFSFSSTLDHALNMAVVGPNSTTVLCNEMHTRPNGTVTPKSGQPYWFETNVGVTEVSNAKSLYIGLATSTGLNSTLMSDASTLNNSTSLIGFWMHGGSKVTFDAIVQKGTPAATASPSTILADVLNAPANNPDPGNPNFTPPTPPGNLTSTSFVKLGLLYDGRQYVYWFVNGSQVAKAAVDASAFNTSSTYGGISAILAPDNSNTVTLVTKFFRQASKQF